MNGDGVESDATKGLGWRPGDTIEVGVTFDGGAARVTPGHQAVQAPLRGRTGPEPTAPGTTVDRAACCVLYSTQYGNNG